MMSMRALPAIGPRYWAALCLASVFGANMGDFVAHNLHLGHSSGLLPLALVFAGIVLAERQSRLGNAGYYWAAIVTLRTAATNLADLGTHDFKLSPPWVLGSLTAFLCALLVSRRSAHASQANASQANASQPGAALPENNANYWVSMLVAGTLGTALGDTLADYVGLGVGPATLILSVILAGLFGLRSPYWVLVVAIRTVGTTLGDWVTDTVGLTPGTLITGLAFVGMLWLWSPQRKDQWTEAARPVS